jgi:small subunit ribosomal protein S21
MSKKQKQHQSIVPGNALAVKVNGSSREDLAQALKTFKRKIKSSGILEEIRERKEFIKPGVKKRKQLQNAKFMQMVRDLHAK